VSQGKGSASGDVSIGRWKLAIDSRSGNDGPDADLHAWRFCQQTPSRYIWGVHSCQDLSERRDM